MAKNPLDPRRRARGLSRDEARDRFSATLTLPPTPRMRLEALIGSLRLRFTRQP